MHYHKVMVRSLVKSVLRHFTDSVTALWEKIPEGESHVGKNKPLFGGIASKVN